MDRESLAEGGDKGRAKGRKGRREVKGRKEREGAGRREEEVREMDKEGRGEREGREEEGEEVMASKLGRET